MDNARKTMFQNEDDDRCECANKGFTTLLRACVDATVFRVDALEVEGARPDVIEGPLRSITLGIVILFPKL